jgi:hypothetical protein
MIDNYTVVLYGWRIEDQKEINKFVKKLEKIDEDYYDKFQNIMVEDVSAGGYFYFGAVLVRYDATDDPDAVIINSELINKATSEYHKTLEKYPELEKLFKKYTKTPAQLFVFQHIW